MAEKHAKAVKVVVKKIPAEEPKKGEGLIKIVATGGAKLAKNLAEDSGSY